MYRFDAEDPGQSLYTPTTVGVILIIFVDYKVFFFARGCVQTTELSLFLYPHLIAYFALYCLVCKKNSSFFLSFLSSSHTHVLDDDGKWALGGKYGG